MSDPCVESASIDRRTAIGAFGALGLGVLAAGASGREERKPGQGRGRVGRWRRSTP